MPDTPSTEDVNPSTADLDLMDTRAMLHRINDEDRRAASAVERAIDTAAAAVDAVAERLRRGGHLHYFGAGSSGRLAMADAAEMPPTFSTPPDMVQAHIAGGSGAVATAREADEDDAGAGAGEVRNARIGSGDVAVGISASGAARYVCGALHAAREAGALTIAIVNVDNSALAEIADIPIVLRTGAEALAGSTRMKAAAAQKMALTMLSTAVMVKLGRVYGNLMVDVAPRNAKLRARAIGIVAAISGATAEDAAAAIDACGETRVAAVMLVRRCGVDAARAALAATGGSLRTVLKM